MGILSGLFHSRDKPKNSTNGSSYRFLFGGSTSGNRVTEHSAMQMTAVYACVRILSDAIAGLPVHLYQYSDKGSKEKAIKHPLYFILHDEPNPEMTSFVFRETLMPHLLLWGNFSQLMKNLHFVKFNVDGLLRGDYQSRTDGYAMARQNEWMSANDIRELENLDLILEEDGGDLYLINGKMTKLADAGIFASGGKEQSDKEVLEVEEQDGNEPGDDGTDTGEDSVSRRDHRRRKLV